MTVSSKDLAAIALMVDAVIEETGYGEVRIYVANKEVRRVEKMTSQLWLEEAGQK